MTKEQAQQLVETEAWQALEEEQVRELAARHKAVVDLLNGGQYDEAERMASEIKALTTLFQKIYSVADKPRRLAFTGVLVRPD